jgi:hypothetical protein
MGWRWDSFWNLLQKSGLGYNGLETYHNYQVETGTLTSASLYHLVIITFFFLRLEYRLPFIKLGKALRLE